MQSPETDVQHTCWSDPGAHRSRLSELPGSPAEIADSLEEFTIHHAVARQIGFEIPAVAERDRSLRYASLLLGELVRRDSRHLSQHRAIADYLYVTCRDFALLAVSALRERGVPARLRAGFASYFNRGYWEDHYVCEHRSRGDWAILDAQLGPRARAGFRITFDIADAPASAWRSGASMWRAVRSGEVDPQVCGLSTAGIAGDWWIAASVLRDAAALAGTECLPWDDWGPSGSFRSARRVTPEQARDIDAIAEALDPAPPDRREAQAVLARFPWASPPPDAFSVTPSE